MRIIEQKVFAFSELSKEVQEKVIAKWYELEDYPSLTEDLTESLKAMNKQCFYDVKLSYSLSYCQGDGLSFTGTLDFEKFLENIYSKRENLKPSVKKALSELVFYIRSKGNAGRYAYSSKSDIEFEYNSNDTYTHLENMFESDILPEIQDYYMSICRDIETEGYNILDYRMSIDEFTELAESNSYEYFEDGKMF
jgi:hypothetical protein